MTRTGKFWGIGILVGVILIVASLFLSWLPSSSGATDGPSAPSTSPSAGLTDQQKAQLTQLLTVNTVTVKCATVTDLHVVKYDVGALKSVPPRLWSDSLSTPLTGGVKGLQTSICTDPLLGVSYANMFSALKVDGVSVLALNPWLKPYVATSQINDKAAGFMPLMDVTSPSDAQLNAAVKANHAYQGLANRLNTLLSRFVVSGTHTLTSAKNWHLSGAGLTVGSLPEVSLDTRQDSRPALVFEATLKNWCAPVVRIGANVGDKRPEVFSVPVCTTPTHPGTPSTPGYTPSPTPSPCTMTAKPHDPTHTYVWKNCKWVVKGSSLNDGDQHQPVQSDAGNQSAAQSQSGSVSTAPSSQSTVPVNTASPATPTPGGYNGGGTSQPGTTAPPDPGPSQSSANSGDPGGFH